MHERLQKLAIIAGGVILTLLALTADAARPDLDAAWQEYSANRTSLKPAYTFPHATCFRVASLEYGLPESLLLAVARGESDFQATARSRANAHGVMQILWPDTARHLGIHRRAVPRRNGHRRQDGLPAPDRECQRTVGLVLHCRRYEPRTSLPVP